jgi:hypothetical protein
MVCHKDHLVDHFCKIGTIDVTIQCYLQSVIVEFSQIATCQHELVVRMFGVPKNVFPLMVFYRGFTKILRTDYVKWKEENRLQHDGVNAVVCLYHISFRAFSVKSIGASFCTGEGFVSMFLNALIVVSFDLCSFLDAMGDCRTEHLGEPL